MPSDARSTEVVYAAPARTGAWWASLVGAVAFVAFVTWIAWRMFDDPVAAVAVLALAAAAPLVLGRSGPLRVRRERERDGGVAGPIEPLGCDDLALAAARFADVTLEGAGERRPRERARECGDGRHRSGTPGPRG
jgi:hypothetical protein